MKKESIVILVFIIFESSFILGQNIIHSTCINDTSIHIPDLEEFALEIALSEMWYDNHYYHDSILVPQAFYDSIRNYLSAYDNAIHFSDSVIDYRDFYSLFITFGNILMTVTPNSNCFIKQNDEFIITNDTLSRYIDSLNLYANSYVDNELMLTDTNSRINIYGNFDFFYNISCITNIELLVPIPDVPDCYKSRTGQLFENHLNISLYELNYCDTNSYDYRWDYKVTNDCNIEILNYPITSILTNTIESLKIYPNPINSLNTINIKLINQIDLSTALVKVVNLNGEVIKNFNLDEYGIGDEISLEWNGKTDNGIQLGKGIYILYVTTTEKTYTIKIVKTN